MNRFSHLSLIGLASALALGAAGAGAQTAAPSAPASTPPAAGTPAPAAADPIVGGAPMSPLATIVENASKSKDHTSLVGAVKAAGLVETLSGPGPFTVFAPTNDAFARAGAAVEPLMKPENKAILVKVLTYHVVPGKLTLAELTKLTTAEGGTATLTTVEGGKLKVIATPQKIELTDENGNKSFVTQPDIAQSNGVVHVTNGLLLPKLDAKAAAAAATPAAR